MTDEQKIELAATFGIGPNSGLAYARALLSSSKPVAQPASGADHD